MTSTAWLILQETKLRLENRSTLSGFQPGISWFQNLNMAQFNATVLWELHPHGVWHTASSNLLCRRKARKPKQEGPGHFSWSGCMYMSHFLLRRTVFPLHTHSRLSPFSLRSTASHVLGFFEWPAWFWFYERRTQERRNLPRVTQWVKCGTTGRSQAS